MPCSKCITTLGVRLHACRDCVVRSHDIGIGASYLVTFKSTYHNGIHVRFTLLDLASVIYCSFIGVNRIDQHTDLIVIAVSHSLSLCVYAFMVL